MQQRCETSFCWCCTFPVLIFQRHLNQGHTTVNARKWWSEYTHARTQAHARRLEGHANRGEYRNVDFPTKPFFFFFHSYFYHSTSQLEVGLPSYFLCNFYVTHVQMSYNGCTFCSGWKTSVYKKGNKTKWKESARNVNIMKPCTFKHKY